MDGLLAPGEAAAVELREGRGAFVFAVEHASNRMPRALGTLGLPVADLDRHIAWDPGAEAVAAALAERFGGDLLLQRYSRLVIDCNRAPDLADAIVVRSEDTDIPGNAGLTPQARAVRVDEVWAPFHDALSALIDRRIAARRPTALVTVHTFTPVYRGVRRPWHAGIIWTGERTFADVVLASLRREPGLVVGDNEPYAPKDNVDYTIRRHGFDRGIPHVMIEIRNDLVRDAEGQAAWAARLSRAIADFNVGERAA